MDEIVKKFCNGDQLAFEQLFRAFFSAGKRFVKSFVVDEGSVDDILQEVFINLWDKRQRILSEAHFKAYFYKSLRNNTIKRISRSKHTIEVDELNIESDDLFIKITKVEFEREISQAISKLPERRREIILLSMSGMSEKMIGDTLGISVNTVKNQKTKAYTSLRIELKNLYCLMIIIGLAEGVFTTPQEFSNKDSNIDQTMLDAIFHSEAV